MTSCSAVVSCCAPALTTFQVMPSWGLVHLFLNILLFESPLVRAPRAEPNYIDHVQNLERMSTIAGLPVGRAPSWILAALAAVPGTTKLQTAARKWPQLLDLWQRRSSDDLAFMLLSLISDFTDQRVPSTQVNAGDAQSFVSMCTKCRREIQDCLSDPECRKALDGASCSGPQEY